MICSFISMLNRFSKRKDRTACSKRDFRHIDLGNLVTSSMVTVSEELRRNDHRILSFTIPFVYGRDNCRFLLLLHDNMIIVWAQCGYDRDVQHQGRHCCAECFSRKTMRKKVRSSSKIGVVRKNRSLDGVFPEVCGRDDGEKYRAVD